jgi:hypothetical protein
MLVVSITKRPYSSAQKKRQSIMFKPCQPWPSRSSQLDLPVGTFQSCCCVEMTLLATAVAHSNIGSLSLKQIMYLHITSSHEFSSNVKLWNSWPLRKVLDSLSNSVIGKNIDRVKIQVEGVEDLHSRVAEATLREQLVTLHEQEDRMGINQFLDAFLRVV